MPLEIVIGILDKVVSSYFFKSLLKPLDINNTKAMVIIPMELANDVNIVLFFLLFNPFRANLIILFIDDLFFFNIVVFISVNSFI